MIIMIVVMTGWPTLMSPGSTFHSELAKLAARNDKLEAKLAELAKTVNELTKAEDIMPDNRKYRPTVH